MQKADNLAHAAKVVAMCVSPVVMAQVGLLLQSKKSGRTSAVARGWSTPAINAKAGRQIPRQWRRIAAPRDRKGGGHPCRDWHEA